MGAIAIYSSGMVTGVGLDAPSSCAAIRAGITGFTETRFMFDGEWLQGCPVVLAEPWRGVEKLGRMAAAAIVDCLAGDTSQLRETPILVSVAEEDRPGRFAKLDDRLLGAIASELGQTLHVESRLFTSGRVGGVHALDHARQRIAAGERQCIVAGVDTYLIAETLAAYHRNRRLATEGNSNGFIPGEAAAAVLVGPVKRHAEPQLLCLGMGYGREPAPLEAEAPTRSEGLFGAITSAFADSRCSYADVDFRLVDNSGEAYGFKDTDLALLRTMRERKDAFDVWHPADCIGEVGAAVVPVILGVMRAASDKGYAPGPGALCHVSGNGDQRAAFVIRHQTWSREGR